MNNNDPIHSNIDDQLFLLVENALDADGVERIESWLSSGPKAKQYYLNFMADYSAMKNQANAMIDMDEETIAIRDEYDVELWSALAEVERAAERVPEEDNEVQKSPLPQKVERQPVFAFNRSSLIIIVLSAAAMLSLIVFLRVSPDPAVEVATLSGSVNAVFAGGADYQSGRRLFNADDSIWLQKGAITIRFDYGAEVVIEAPAEFCLNSPDDMTLRYGRLYARVPGRSRGFTLETPVAQVIDLGTEFAVKVDYDQTCEVHMIKGKASLIPGVKGQAAGDSRILTAHQARHVNLSGQVTDIPVKATGFIREIDTQTGFVWRGNDRLSLADIVGGGNGFGTGKLEYGINPETGVLAYRDRERKSFGAYQGFIEVQDSPYVDGVFCPAKETASVQISSRGDMFEACPLTTGTFWGNVMNSGWFGQTGQAEGSFNDNLSLGGQVYGSSEFPAITMHPNLGVTFDLDAVRSRIGQLALERFTALCGISELVLKEGGFSSVPKASFYVLLDGQMQFERVDMTPTDGAVNIDLDIPEDVRFLTLMVTEGNDRTYDGDWTLFAEPMLHLLHHEY